MRMALNAFLDLELIPAIGREELRFAVPDEDHVLDPKVVLPLIPELWLDAEDHTIDEGLRHIRLEPGVLVDLDAYLVADCRLSSACS